jgi:hypothetical protein
MAAMALTASLPNRSRARRRARYRSLPLAGVVALIAVAEQTRTKAAKGSRWCDYGNRERLGKEEVRRDALPYFFLESETYFGCWTKRR